MAEIIDKKSRGIPFDADYAKLAEARKLRDCLLNEEA